MNVAQRSTTLYTINDNNKFSNISKGKFSYSNNNINITSNNDNYSKVINKVSTTSLDSAPYTTLCGRQPVHVHPSSVLFSMGISIHWQLLNLMI